jgi:transposase
VSKAQQDVRRKIRALEHAARTGNIRQTCRYFGIPRSLFYLWRAAYQQEGEAGLVNKKPCARFHPKTTAPAIVDQILHLRRTYHLGRSGLSGIWSGTTTSGSATPRCAAPSSAMG